MEFAFLFGRLSRVFTVETAVDICLNLGKSLLFLCVDWTFKVESLSCATLFCSDCANRGLIWTGKSMYDLFKATDIFAIGTNDEHSHPRCNECPGLEPNMQYIQQVSGRSYQWSCNILNRD